VRQYLAVQIYRFLPEGCMSAQAFLYDLLPRPIQEFTVVVKVLATDCRHAADVACERLNTGGEPDAVLTCDVMIADPECPERTIVL
jgi:hypothetical protein